MKMVWSERLGLVLIFISVVYAGPSVVTWVQNGLQANANLQEAVIPKIEELERKIETLESLVE